MHKNARSHSYKKTHRTFSGKNKRANTHPLTRKNTKSASLSSNIPIEMRRYHDKFMFSYDNNLKRVKTAIKQFSGKHAIDPEMKENFINRQLTEIRRRAARDLIENTIYITLREVCSIVENLILQLYKEHGLSTVYFYSGNPDKSFYFLSVLALYYIRKHKYKDPIFVSDLKKTINFVGDKYPIVILDDVSYSGSQMSNMLNSIYYDVVIYQKKSPPNIYVALVALNTFSKLKIEKVPTHKDKFGYSKYITSPFKILYEKDRLYTPLILKIGIERNFYVNLFFNFYNMNTCMPYVSIYLDHKIADSVSTYKTALMYGPIVPSNYNYKIIEEYDIIIPDIREIYNVISHDINTEERQQVFEEMNKLKNRAESDGIMLNEQLNLQNIIKKMKNDIYDETQTMIHLYPLIKTCNKSHTMLNNVSDSNIQNLNYFQFMIPDQCLNKNRKDCEVDVLVVDSIVEILEFNIKDVIQTSKQIHSYICPDTWYKTGDLKMKQ